jgi:hypothetical protein
MGAPPIRSVARVFFGCGARFESSAARPCFKQSPQHVEENFAPDPSIDCAGGNGNSNE